jgi:hypothetical protein
MLKHLTNTIQTQLSNNSVGKWEGKLAACWEDKWAACSIVDAQIFRAEVLAVSWFLQQEDLATNFVVRIDNLPLVQALNNGRSNITEINTLIQDVLMIRSKGYIITFV